MKTVVLLLAGVFLLVGCAKPPELVYTHPKTGTSQLAVHISECNKLSEKFGYINMSPVHNYPMANMPDRFQRKKVFRYCMLKKGYEQGESIAVDGSTTSIIIADSELSAGEKALVTISFQTAVGGLENSDLTVSSGTLTNVQTADHGLTWTAIFTPTPNVEASENVITLDNSGVFNLASNPGSGFTTSNKYSVDSLAPTVAINFRDTHLGTVAVDFEQDDLFVRDEVSRSIVYFTFSEPPLNFSMSDIAVANGTISDLVQDDSTHYHVTFTAQRNFLGRGSVSIGAVKFTDQAKNGNRKARPDTVMINTLRPNITARR